jgi:hypothetical protein
MRYFSAFEPPQIARSVGRIVLISRSTRRCTQCDVRGTSNFLAGAASGPLGTTPQLWLNLQTDYDVQMALRALGKKLATIEPVAEATSS